MKNILIILFSLLSISTFATDGNTIGWKTYFAYYTTNSVEESNDQVFVVADGSLYTYGKDDNSIKQYYKNNGLYDNTISFIRYNKQTESLIIVYTNSNIDIMEKGSTRNLPYILNNTSFSNKVVNSIMIYKEYAYLSMPFGIVVVNMDKKEITNTYNLSQNISSCSILNNTIYASTSNGIIYGSIDDNLLDSSNWNTYSLPEFPVNKAVDKIVTFNNQLFYLIKNNGVYYESNNRITPLVSNNGMNEIKLIGEKLACISTSQVYIFTDTRSFDRIDNLSIKDISTYQTDKYWIAEGTKGLRSIKKNNTNQFEPVNEAILLDGPSSNNPYKIVAKNDKVYIIQGGKNLQNGSRFNRTGNIMIYDYDKWSLISSNEVQTKLGKRPRDYTSIAINTNNPEEEIIYASSLGDGIVEYRNGEPVKLYDEKNSPIENAGGRSSNYCYMDGLTFDNEGNLWMTNSEVNNAIKILDTNGEWHSLSVPSLNNKYTINDILVTSNNDKWVNISRPTDQICITVIGNSASLDEATSNDFVSFTDTDNNSFSPNSYTCMAEDKNGYVWIGTSKGPIYFTSPRQAITENSASMRCTRVKLINEEDGTPYYFLDNLVITTIKVDNGNRKWIGTQGNGVYVLSEDNQEVVHQFNTTNSILPSDQIYSIDINEKTGEVFIGTNEGLVSYKGEATEGKSNYSEVSVFPNPVRPEYADKVTITGLMDNSNVKITDLRGNIIYQTKSLGGQATWNCRNAKGARVATGIYLVLSSTDEAKESVVTKIAVVK